MSEKALYYPWRPELASGITVEGIECLLYLSESIYWQTLTRLAEDIDPTNSTILTNLNGARLFVNDLKNMWQEYGKNLRKTLFKDIKYFSTDDKATTGHVVRAISLHNSLKGLRVLACDEIGDSHKVAQAIKQDAQGVGVGELKMVTLMDKTAYPEQVPFNFDHTGVIIDYFAWVGGWGSNIGKKGYSHNFPRSSRNLIVLKN